MRKKNVFDLVRVRCKAIAGGNRSIYLDYRLEDGTRRIECLKMYLLPEKMAEARKLNGHTLRAVANIKAQRLTNLAWNKAANDGVEQSRRRLLDVIDEYVELRTKCGAPSAGQRYGGVKRHVAKLNADVRLWEVNLDFVSSLARSMMNERNGKGEPLAKATIVNVVTALGSVMKYAVRKGMARLNPVDLYDMRGVKGPVRRRTYLIANELRRLAATPCKDEGIKRLFLFACFTGLRFSDLVTLRWRDIQSDGVGMRIEKMMSKTRRMVYVPLNNTAQHYLPPRACSALVFCDIPRVTQVDAVLKEWARRAGIEKKVTFYTSRHTFATLSLTQGADLYCVSQLLGHKDIRTTEGYANIVDRKKVEAVGMIDSLFTDMWENHHAKTARYMP